MTDYLLSSILREKNTELLMKVKDKFLDAEGVKWFGFVRHSLANTRSMPTKQAIELKFNISLNETQDKAEHWWAEVQKSYKKRVVEDAVKAASRDQANGFEIFQKAITEANSEDGARVFQYGGGSTDRYDTYQTIKSNAGISYLPIGLQCMDETTYGYTRADLWTIAGSEGSGKAQPLSEPIPTPSGWRTMGDIKVGDLVFGSDGKPQKVMGVFPQGVRAVYRIDFGDGSHTFCDKDHLWQVYSKALGIKKAVMTVGDMLEKMKTRQAPNFKIPVTQPVQYPKRELLLDPYLMGALLGDAHFRQGDVVMTKEEQEMIDDLTSLWNNCNVYTGSDGSRNIRFRGISDILNHYGLIGTNSFTKFIPEDYLYSSVEDRLALLRGLMDTDGYCVSNSPSNAEFTSRSKALRDGVRELVMSLGGFCKPTEKTVIGKPNYIARASFPDETFVNPFKLTRKASLFRRRGKTSNGGKVIKSITYSHEEESQCISVENPDHLYLTRDYLVTHNTWLLLKLALLLDGYMQGKNLDKPILVVNTEVDTDELLGRMDCLRFKLDYGLFMQGQLEKRDEMRYKRGLQTLKSNIKVVDDCFDINDVANYMVLYNPAIVFIDGSHLLAKEYEWKEIANLTAGMKKMTRRYQVPIINTTHLKSGKGKEKEGGTVDDFAYGKGYTRNADVALMIFKTDLMELEGEIGLDFVKVRRGKKRKMVLKTDFKTMEYTYLREASSDTEVEEETPTVGW